MERENTEAHGRREAVMSQSTCPRCDTSQVVKIADSPVKGKWEAYRCKECNYVWRSTEDTTNVGKKIKYWRETVARFW